MEQQARTRSVLNSLVALAVADDEFELDNLIAYYERRGAFTPAQMALLQWRFARHQVEHRLADFKVKPAPAARAEPDPGDAGLEGEAAVALPLGAAAAVVSKGMSLRAPSPTSYSGSLIDSLWG